MQEVREASSLVERKRELADKLELIRAMAEFNGFSLQDILDEADIKKEKNGSFKKRLLLEKVIEKWFGNSFSFRANVKFVRKFEL